MDSTEGEMDGVMEWRGNKVVWIPLDEVNNTETDGILGILLLSAAALVPTQTFRSQARHAHRRYPRAFERGPA